MPITHECWYISLILVSNSARKIVGSSLQRRLRFSRTLPRRCRFVLQRFPLIPLHRELSTTPGIPDTLYTRITILVPSCPNTENFKIRPLTARSPEDSNTTTLDSTTALAISDVALVTSLPRAMCLALAPNNILFPPRRDPDLIRYFVSSDKSAPSRFSLFLLSNCRPLPGFVFVLLL